MTQPDDSAGDMVRDTAQRLFRTHCDSATCHAAEQGRWPAGLWEAVAEAGLPRALLAETAGGFGIAPADALSLLGVAGAHAAPIPLAETMLALLLLAKAGLDLPDGPLAAAPVRAGETVTLTPVAGGWHVAGTITRVPWGRHLDQVAVLAGPRVALVGKTSWSIEPGENVAREPRDTLHLDGPALAVAPAAITEAELIAIGAALRTQQIAGAVTRLVEMTTQYAQDRVQFGRPLGKFQAVQQNLAVLAGQAAAATASASLAAEALGATVKILPIAAAKARAGEAAGIAAAIAHQIHGAIGFTFEHELHRLTRRLWSWRDEYGNDAAWHRLLGRHMAQAGAEQLWAALTAA